MIFFYYDQDIVNGGFFDNFEYYYLAKKMFKDFDVRLRLISDATENQIGDFINDKYEDVEPFIFDGIEAIKHQVNMRLLKPIKPDWLFCATNSSLYWFLKNGGFTVSENVIAMGDYLDHHPKYDKYFCNFYFFYDDRVFEPRSELDVPYRKKILFDKYRKKEFGNKYDYMLNMALVERRFSKEFFNKLFKDHQGTYVVYVGSKNEEYYSWMNDLDFVTLIKPPVKDFMGLFKTFIYIPYNNGWDATPRLIPECVFYNKDIIYYDNDSNIKAGGYYRFKDTKENYKGLWLKEYDEVYQFIYDTII